MIKLLLAAAGAIVMLMGGSGCTTEGTERGGAAGIVTVQYVRPENFTDLRLQVAMSGPPRRSLLEKLPKRSSR